MNCYQIRMPFELHEAYMFWHDRNKYLLMPYKFFSNTGALVMENPNPEFLAYMNGISIKKSEHDFYEYFDYDRAEYKAYLAVTKIKAITNVERLHEAYDWSHLYEIRYGLTDDGYIDSFYIFNKNKQGFNQLSITNIEFWLDYDKRNILSFGKKHEWQDFEVEIELSYQEKIMLNTPV